jgi:carboxyl-terminal processing protease
MQKITGLIHKEPVVDADAADFTSFWNAWQILSEKFPGADTVSAQDRVYGAIKGLASSFGDPYTTFFPPKDNVAFQTEISGSFNGVGIEIGQKDGILTVIAPLKGTPADRAGIRAGDKIVKIGDKITSDMSIDSAIELIRGKEGTPIELTTLREGVSGPQVFTLTREHIALPTAETEKREKEKVFIIHLYNFSAESPDAFKNGLDEYLASGYHNLVIDLRDNPGGYLDAADKIGGWFIPEGKVIVKEIGKTPDDVTVHTSKGPVLFPKGDKLVVLANKGSASAAEILAGALSEQGIGTLAGEQTFGKGSVQEVVSLTPDTSLKVTVAKWYTPNGVSISEKGLAPQVEIKLPADAKSDVQLDEAVALFKKL